MVRTSETKNQGLKGSRQDQEQDFVSQDQDIKTEFRDISRTTSRSKVSGMQPLLVSVLLNG